MSSSQTIFQFPEVRVVEASAGSGKTFALAKRYVQLILDPRVARLEMPMRGILAITFMKKASFEMKERILLFLKKIALKTMSPADAADILGPIGLDLDGASPRAFALMDELIHQYNFFQVQTIDAFINALLSGSAYKIGLSARFKIKHNPFDYLQYGLDRLIERAAHDPKMNALFTRFLDQYLLLENKSGWFPKKDILGLVNALFHQRNSYGMDFLCREDDADIFSQMGQIVSLMRELKANLPSGTHSGLVKALDAFLARYTSAFDFDRVSKFFQRPEFPVKKGGEVPDAVERLWEKIRAHLTRLAESEAHQLFAPYVALFRELIQEFDAKAAADDILFMEELNRKARLLFDEGGVTVEELYYRLATRFRHYLVDEFQDTSRLQWQNLVMMVEEALSTGGSLFYVGDKKQAIYGFRGGEVRLFDQIKQDFAHFNVQVERLAKNYRSAQAIVEFNNRLFSLENLERFVAARQETASENNSADDGDTDFSPEDQKRLHSAFGQSRQEWCEGRPIGYVRVEHVCGAKRGERDEVTRERLVALLHELHGRFLWKDIAVLTRKNSEVEDVTGWLMEEAIPVKSERTLNIKENLIVQELVSLLTFLNSPIDEVAFAKVILGEAFTRGAGLTTEQTREFLLAQRGAHHQQKKDALYREFRRAFPEVWQRSIEPFFRQVGHYPLYEFLISILKEWNVFENFADQSGFVMQLLEVVKKHEDEGCDLVSFLDDYEHLQSDDLFVHVADTDAVAITTAHKAKGLEFPVVILPFAAMEIQVGQRGGSPGEELGQRSYVVNTDGDHMELLRIKKDYLAYSPPLKDIYRRQSVDSLFSELNNMYVALTRARQELYIFIPEKSGNTKNLLRLFIPEDLTSMGTPVLKEKAGAFQAQASILPIGSYQDWMRYLKEEFAADDDVLVNRGQIRQGKMLHAMLSCVGNMNETALDEVLARAKARAAQEFPLVKDLDRYVKQLETMLARQELRRFFYPDNAEVLLEQEIVDAQGKIRRLDRCIVMPYEAWVVDFKSSRAAREQHGAQVREYLDIVGQMYPKKAVKGFLIYLDEGGVEEVS